MKGNARVQLAAVLLGLSAAVLTGPLFPSSSWWLWLLITGGVAGLAGYVIAHAVNRLPGASPKTVATVSTAVTVVAVLAGSLALGGRLDSVEAIVIVVAAFALFRLVIVTVDRFTPSFTVSLLAGHSGSLLFIAAVPLLARAHPSLSVWACLGIGAGAGFLVGTLVGAALRPLFDGVEDAGSAR